MHRSPVRARRLLSVAGPLAAVAALCLIASCGSDAPASAPTTPVATSGTSGDGTAAPVAQTLPAVTETPTTGVSGAPLTNPPAGDATTVAPAATVAPAPTPAPSVGGGSCHVSVTGGAVAEWDGVGGQQALTSGYWMSDDQRTQYEATMGQPPQVLLLNCAGNDPLALVTLSANDEAAFAFAPGDYPVKVFGTIPGVLGYALPPDQAATVHITEFNDTHIAGTVTYTVDDRGNGPINVELTFDFDKPI